MTQKGQQGTGSNDYKIVSMPMVDVTELPLHLSAPDVYSTGGCLAPSSSGSTYVYSSVDLLVAGLEAIRFGLIVNNLPIFFDTYREMHSMHKVQLTVKINGNIDLYTIAELRYLSINNYSLLTMCRHNAPLTFKWVSYDCRSETSREKSPLRLRDSRGQDSNSIPLLPAAD